MKSVNKFGSDSFDQHQPSEARLPTAPEIPLIIANSPNLTVIPNVTFNDNQQVVKNKGKTNLDQHFYSLSNSIMSAKDDTKKNHVRTDKTSTNITLISHVSKHNNELNPRLNTCNYRRNQTNFILPKQSLSQVPIIRTSINHNFSKKINKNSIVCTNLRTTNLKNSTEGKTLTTILTPVLLKTNNTILTNTLKIYVGTPKHQNSNNYENNTDLGNKAITIKFIYASTSKERIHENNYSTNSIYKIMRANTRMN